MTGNFLNKQNNFCKKSTLNVLFFILYSLILVFLVECFSRGNINASFNFFRHFFKIFLYNSLIVGFTLSPCFLFKKRVFAFSLVSLTWIILSIANNLVIKFRETPLTFSDLGMIQNALELSNQYLSKSSIILIILLFIVVISILSFLFFKCKKYKIKYIRNITSLLIFFALFKILLNYGLDNDIISKNFWDITGGYNQYGFSYSFYNSAVNNGMSKPNGYSKNTIAGIKNELDILTAENSNNKALTSSAIIEDNSSNKEVNSDTSIIKPNIIIVQLESFINPNWITDIELNKNPVSNFEALSDYFTSGLLSVPSFGGGTANTEFEVITGMSTEFFGTGEFLFNTIASKKSIPSLAHSLKNLGYSANALHNHEGKFYTRDKVYKNLGFDSFTPIECMSPPERTLVGWPKDNVLINEICNIITSTDNPDLIFGVSVQGHGGYPNDYVEDKEIYITNDYSKDNKNSLEYYINQIYEMDQFVANLIDAVNTLDEPTIIAFYGDHFPAVGLDTSDVSINTLKSTPYVILDNIGLDVTNKNIKAYELTSLIIDKLSFPSTALSTLHNSDLDSETKKEYLNQLEYDMLYGRNYTDEYSKLTPSENYRIGFKDISISNFEVVDDSITIIGSNFNTFSRVFVNNKEVPTNFIDENTLSINKLDCDNNSIIKVCQLASSASTVFSSSNEVTINY